MGGGGSKATTVQNTSLPSYITKEGKSLVSRADTLSKTPYTAYTDQRIADLPQESLNAISLANSSTGNWQPDIAGAEADTNAAGKSWTEADVGAYMNPYTTNVTDIAARQMLRNEGIAQKGRNAAAVDSGSFGSAQAGVQAAEADRNLQTNISDTYAKGQAAAYDNAQSMFNADRAASLAAGGQLANIGTTKSQLTDADYQRLMGAGATEQQQKQNELDWNYQQFQDKQNWDWNQLSKASDILAATPYSTSGSSSTNTQGGNQTAQMVGAGVTVAATVAIAAVAI